MFEKSPPRFALRRSGRTSGFCFLHWFHASTPSLSFARCSGFAKVLALSVQTNSLYLPFTRMRFSSFSRMRAQLVRSRCVFPRQCGMVHLRFHVLCEERKHACRSRAPCNLKPQIPPGSEESNGSGPLDVPRNHPGPDQMGFVEERNVWQGGRLDPLRLPDPLVPETSALPNPNPSTLL